MLNILSLENITSSIFIRTILDTNLFKNPGNRLAVHIYKVNKILKYFF